MKVYRLHAIDSRGRSRSNLLYVAVIAPPSTIPSIFVLYLYVRAACNPEVLLLCLILFFEYPTTC